MEQTTSAAFLSCSIVPEDPGPHDFLAGASQPVVVPNTVDAGGTQTQPEMSVNEPSKRNSESASRFTTEQLQSGELLMEGVKVAEELTSILCSLENHMDGSHVLTVAEMQKLEAAFSEPLLRRANAFMADSRVMAHKLN